MSLLATLGGLGFAEPGPAFHASPLDTHSGVPLRSTPNGLLCAPGILLDKFHEGERITAEHQYSVKLSPFYSHRKVNAVMYDKLISIPESMKAERYGCFTYANYVELCRQESPETLPPESWLEFTFKEYCWKTWEVNLGTESPEIDFDHFSRLPFAGREFDESIMNSMEITEDEFRAIYETFRIEFGRIMTEIQDATPTREIHDETASDETAVLIEAKAKSYFRETEKTVRPATRDDLGSQVDLCHRNIKSPEGIEHLRLALTSKIFPFIREAVNKKLTSATFRTGSTYADTQLASWINYCGRHNASKAVRSYVIELHSIPELHRTLSSLVALDLDEKRLAKLTKALKEKPVYLG
ncbi:hypothetical protein ACIQWN_38870 [Streptomyces vinaceus]|uniref:hypothetical protein n=1 Tax=Streptomyces vinaceus TaxID=1960 RepID=UPI00382F16A6